MSSRHIKTPVSQLKGVGPKITQSMEEKGITTVEDLLYFLPLRYMDRRTIHTVADLAEGERGNIIATVTAYRSLFFRHARKKGYEVVVEDETGSYFPEVVPVVTIISEKDLQKREHSFSVRPGKQIWRDAANDPP